MFGDPPGGELGVSIQVCPNPNNIDERLLLPLPVFSWHPLNPSSRDNGQLTLVGCGFGAVPTYKTDVLYIVFRN